MKHKSLIIYLSILTVLSAFFIVGVKTFGQNGAYLAQGYMLTPAIAAIITRVFFYEARFRDANLGLGKLKDYFKFYLVSLGITALSFLFFTVLGGISWDFTGEVFLERLAQQFAEVGQDMKATLPPGLTPNMMLLIYFIGGLTVFNIMPGLITGFGEEFGHRGFMFPQLYRIKPWVGIVVGGLIWFVWHLPLALVIPQTFEYSFWQAVLNYAILAVGSLCTFTYLAYVYVKSRNIWVASLAHIAMNNSAVSFSYFVVVQSQLLANLGLTLSLMIVVVILYYVGGLETFREYFEMEDLSCGHV